MWQTAQRATHVHRARLYRRKPVQDQERDDALDGSHSHTPTKSDVRNVYRIVARLTSKRAKGENRRVGCPRHNLISHRLGGQRGWLSGGGCHDSSPETCCAHICPSSVTTVDQPRPSIEDSDRCKPARGHAAQAGRECAATRVPRDCGRWRRWGGVEVKAEVVNRSPSAVIAPSSSGLQKEARARVADGLLGCGVGRGCDQLCSGTFSHGCLVALAANGVGGGAAGCPLRLGAHCGSAVHATSVISASFGSEAVEQASISEWALCEAHREVRMDEVRHFFLREQ